MPTFSFASQGGTSLSDRIAAINARQKARMAATQDEEVAEEELMKQVNEDKHEPVVLPEEPVILSRAGYVGSELDILNELTKKVDDLAADVKKMNKHINSIVKSLKKA